jgi:serine/threonine protein kinase
MGKDKRPVIQDESDLTIFVTVRPETGLRIAKWIHWTAEDEAYMGMSFRDPDDITIDEFAAGLVPLDDDDVYPELSAAARVTVARSLDGGTAFIKHCAFRRYQPPRQLREKGFEGKKLAEGCGAKDQLLEEVLVMERLSKTPHPYIVRYLGCRVHRGHITSIVLERLERDLCSYAADKPDDFARIDKDAFLAGVESAVKFLHSLGLAHNDLNPRNVMVREADDGSCSPVLIDFDSCAPLGGRLMTGGTEGFIDPDDPDKTVSSKQHDEFALRRLREWWDEAHELEPDSEEE